MDELRTTIEERRVKLVELEARVRQRDEDAAREARRADALVAQLEQFRRERDSAQDMFRDAAGQVEQLKKQLKSANDQLEELRLLVRDYEDDRNLLRDEVTRITTALREKDLADAEERNALAKRLATCETERQRLTSKLAEAERQRDALMAKLAELEDELVRAGRDRSKLETELLDALNQLKLHRASTERDRLSGEVAATRIKQLADQVAALTKECHELREENDRMKRQLRELSDADRDRRQLEDDLLSMRSDLKERDDLIAELQLRYRAAKAGEADKHNLDLLTKALR